MFKLIHINALPAGRVHETLAGVEAADAPVAPHQKRGIQVGVFFSGHRQVLFVHELQQRSEDEVQDSRRAAQQRALRGKEPRSQEVSRAYMDPSKHKCLKKKKIQTMFFILGKKNLFFFSKFFFFQQCLKKKNFLNRTCFFFQENTTKH